MRRDEHDFDEVAQGEKYFQVLIKMPFPSTHTTTLSFFDKSLSSSLSPSINSVYSIICDEHPLGDPIWCSCFSACRTI
jgi:hypothetical protein